MEFIVNSLSQIESAIASVNPGDVVLIRGGRYMLTSDLRFTRAGTQSNPITWRVYPGELVIFDGSNISLNDWYPLLRVIAPWNRFEDFEVCNNHNNIGSGIGVWDGGDHTTLLRIRSYNNHGCGVHPEGVNYLEVLYCVAYDNYGGGHSDGIGMGGVGSIARGCLAYNNADDGIDAYGGDDCLIEECVAHHNGYNGGDGIGIKYGGPNTVRRCISYLNSIGGYDARDGRNSLTEHCTSYQNGQREFYSGSGDTYRNNIAVGSNELDNAIHDHNTWNLGISDPGFISTNPSSDDFLSLVLGSPCRNAASDGTDLGALQYGEIISDLLGEVEEGYMNITSIELKPSFENISVYINFTGEASEEDYAILEYRTLGGSWRRAPDMVIDLRSSVPTGSTSVSNPYVNQFRGVILKVMPNTNYEVRATIISDYTVSGIEPSGTIKTLNDNPPATGPTITVSPSTFWDALAQATPGTNILLQMGNYHSVGQITFPSGQVDNYIKIRPANTGDRPIIRSDYRYGGISFDGANYVMLQGVEIANTYSRQQILNLHNCRGIILDDIYCLIQGQGWWSQAVTALGGIKDSLISHLVARGAYGPGSDGPFGVMWGEEDGPEGLTIRDCEFYNMWDATGGAGNFSIPGGMFRDTFIYRNRSEGCGDDGFEMEGAGMCCAFYENTVVNASRMSIGISIIGIGPFYIIRSILAGNADGHFKMGGSSGKIFAYHNVLYGGEDGFESAGGGSVIKGLVSRNNIIVVDRYIEENYVDPQADWDFDYDCMQSNRGETGLAFKWNNSQMNLAQLRQLGQEINGVWADPLFVNPGGGDFRLQAGSPCIDAGVVIPGINDADSPWPYSGAAPDIGAIESGLAPAPHADFVPQPSEGTAPLLVQFADQSIGAIDTWQWDFGDGTTSSEQNPSHTYQTPGVYNAILTVIGTGGGNSASIGIVVSAPPIMYVLTISAGPGGITSPSPGDHPYNEGELATITALPDSNYRFVQWLLDGIPYTGDVINVVMSGDRVLVAEFEEIVLPPNEYSVTITTVGQGITQPSGEQTVAEGESITINATPFSDWRFDRWVGDINSSQPTITFLVNENMSVVAVFTEITPPPVTHDLTMSATVGGTTEPALGLHEYDEGTAVVITALPDSDYRFVEWGENGQPLSSNNPHFVIMDSNHDVTAVFEEIVLPPEQHSVTIVVLGEGATVPAPGEHIVQDGEEFEIAANPSEGWRFDGWAGDISGNDSPARFTVSSNMSVIAVFVEKPSEVPGLLTVLWNVLPFFPWEGPPLPRFTGRTWEEIPV